MMRHDQDDSFNLLCYYNVPQDEDMLYSGDMPRLNTLLTTPPFPVEATLRKLGADLRTARIRRRLTLEEVASKIGTSRQLVSRAESGSPSVGIAVFAALLWTLGLLDRLTDIVDPSKDEEGLALVRARDATKAYRSESLDNDF